LRVYRDFEEKGRGGKEALIAKRQRIAA